MSDPRPSGETETLVVSSVPSVAVGSMTALLEELARVPEVPIPGGEGEPRPGERIGRFEVLREIGRGGFGVVYEARDEALGRLVALKLLKPGRSRTELCARWLVEEAEAAAQLQHPNIVALFDLGSYGGNPYLVLELLCGETLASRLRRGPLSAAAALDVATHVARALAHAHGRGVVHRDLKPGNVFMCFDGTVKLLDFGLSRLIGAAASKSGGTPAYMAPERWRGEEEDARADVFALGVLVHDMLAGEPPWPVRNGRSAVLESGPTPRLAGVPRVVADLVQRMIDREPARRPANGTAALDALLSVHSRPWRARARRVAPAAAVLAMVAGLAVGAWRTRHAASAPPEPVQVAVADFANQTGEPELDGLSGMLITSLEQSQRLTVLTRVRMHDLLRQLGKTNVSAVDEVLGRELALSAGVRALVLASIRRFDELYAIELKVLDPVKSEYLFTLKEEGRGKANVPGMIDRLSEATRERLREPVAEVRASSRPVAHLTTASLDAYQHYFRGEQLKEAIRYEPAIDAYRKAIAVDPGFALAHYRIAYLGKFTALDEAERRAEIDAALRDADHIPAKERLLIVAWRAVMDGRSEDAHALYARAVEAYPQDKEVLFMAGDQYLHEDRWSEALPYFERSLALDPTFEPSLMHLADGLAALGRTDELLEVSLRWTERAPSGAGFRALSMAHMLGRKPGEAIEAARRALEIDRSGYSYANLAEVLILAGRYAEVEALLRPRAAPTASRMDRLLSIPALVAALAYQGRRAEALRVAETFPEEAEGTRGSRQALKLDILAGDGPTDAVLGAARAVEGAGTRMANGLAIIYVWLGDLASAERVSARVTPEMRAVYDAAVFWRRGDRASARGLLHELARAPSNEGHAAALWMLAHVAAEIGDDGEVIAWAEALRAAPSGGWRSWGLPQVLLLEARAHERRGDRTRARALLDELVATFQHADPDVPLVAEVRAAHAKLRR